MITCIAKPQVDVTTHVEACAFQYGTTYDSYLATESDRRTFSTTGIPGVVSYVRDGRYLHVSGGLLAPEESKDRLLAALLRWATIKKLAVTFYNLADDDLPRMRRAGFQITKWGEEAVVDLQSYRAVGKPYEWVRRQVNFCQRHGLTTEEFNPDQISWPKWNHVTDDMADMLRTMASARPRRRTIRFLEGQFDPTNPGRRRVFIASRGGAREQIDSLLICNPSQNGSRWSFETYARRADSVRGSIPYLMHAVMLQLRTEGVESISLCLVPGYRCRAPLPGDSALARWGMVVGTEYFRFIYDTRGPLHYKSRFRPRFVNRYIAAKPGLSLRSAWSFVRVLGVLN